MTTQTLTLAAFLSARLDEDEAVARAAPGVGATGAWAAKPEDYEEMDWSVIESTGWPLGGSVEEGIPMRLGISTAAHIARHDPARVLADVEAKRRIVAEAREAEAAAVHVGQIPWADDRRGNVERAAYSQTSAAWQHVLRLLALPYADHPECDEAWRP